MLKSKSGKCFEWELSSSLGAKRLSTVPVITKNRPECSTSGHISVKSGGPSDAQPSPMVSPPPKCTGEGPLVLRSTFHMRLSPRSLLWTRFLHPVLTSFYLCNPILLGNTEEKYLYSLQNKKKSHFPNSDLPVSQWARSNRSLNCIINYTFIFFLIRGKERLLHFKRT